MPKCVVVVGHLSMFVGSRVYGLCDEGGGGDDVVFCLRVCAF